MAIDGRINVDVLFHDTDGTTSLKVVSLEDSTAYTSGKVAIVTGTVGTTTVGIDTTAVVYRSADGSLVQIANLEAVAFKSDVLASAAVGNGPTIHSLNGQVSISPVSASQADAVDVTRLATAGTASYTLVLYGT